MHRQWNKISIARLLEQEKRRLQKFADMWQRNRADNPEHFPDTMNPDDWDEQYLHFTEHVPGA